MYKKLLFAIFICLNALNGFADDYPRNYSVDITHHTFELRLSDSINDIVGKATISMLFKADDVRQIRLDRINKSAKWEGNGMVAELMNNDNGNLEYKHGGDALFIQLGQVAKKNNIYKIVVRYEDVPAAGMKISKTKFGDRGFFNENWPSKTCAGIDRPGYRFTGGRRFQGQIMNTLRSRAAEYQLY
jgi:hypothetical protein